MMFYILISRDFMICKGLLDINWFVTNQLTADLTQIFSSLLLIMILLNYFAKILHLSCLANGQELSSEIIASCVK